MKSNPGATIGIVALLCLLLAAGGIFWLANAPLMPPSQTVMQAIPDDRIPH